MKPHLRHFMRTDRPATFSSAIWYFALQLGQRNFIQRSAVARGLWCSKEAKTQKARNQERAGLELSPGSKRRAPKKRAHCRRGQVPESPARAFHNRFRKCSRMD